MIAAMRMLNCGMVSGAANDAAGSNATERFVLAVSRRFKKDERADAQLFGFWRL